MTYSNTAKSIPNMLDIILKVAYFLTLETSCHHKHPNFDSWVGGGPPSKSNVCKVVWIYYMLCFCVVETTYFTFNFQIVCSETLESLLFTYFHIGSWSQCLSDCCQWWKACTGGWRCWIGTEALGCHWMSQSEEREDWDHREAPANRNSALSEIWLEK